jgi:carbamoyltransferase
MSKLTAMGISTGHDRGAAITIDGKIVVAISNERLSRKKTDRSDQIPVEAMRYCLKALSLTYEDIDVFIYNTTEDINSVPQQFESETNQSLSKLKFLPHHLAHAFGTFCASNFDESVVVVADAMGSVFNDETPIKEWFELENPLHEDGRQLAEGYSIYHFDRTNNNFIPIYTKWIPYPMREGDEDGSIGFMYGTGALHLVYSPKTNSWQAGKLMGLASYADPEFMKNYQSPLILEDDNLKVNTARKFPKVTYTSDFQSKANIAGMYQYDQETASLHLVKMAKKFTSSSNVCVAGGSFLNCNTNESIIKSNLFNQCYFFPPSDDSGIPIGLAYYGYTFLTNELPKTETWMSAYLGKEYTSDEIEEAFLRAPFSMEYFKYDFEEDLLEATANLLSENKVVAWFQGGSEIGPRALGHRSILASPAKNWMMDYINNEIKHREWYRPFAPSVLFEHQSEIFDLDTYSPYMLVTANVKDNWKEKIPAVTHHDGTSRYQSVTSENNPIYYKLINKFYEKTGIPVLLNTSFNGPEEPIVETPLDALKTFYNQNIHAIVINNYLIIRQ